MTCSHCGAALPADARVCGTCHRLVHAAALGEAASRAAALEAEGDLSGALATLRGMLDWLPAGTKQANQLNERIRALSARVDAPEETPASRPRRGLGAIAAAVLALLWKGKILVLFALTKAKFLLVGLTKLPTLLSMFLSVGAYALLFGWKFAVGFVLSIYVHEIGHVVALQRYGISATAPMFIPGLGAFVRLNQYPATEREDATVGLAGPLWGLGAAVACALWWLGTDAPLAAALARTSAWINLFNLTPIWQLDGGRGFRALNRQQRWIAVGTLALAWAISEDSLVLIIALVGAWRAFSDPPSETGDRRILGMYAGLVLALAGLMALIPDPRGI
jgi:Zn-dependent protease